VSGTVFYCWVCGLWAFRNGLAEEMIIRIQIRHLISLICQKHLKYLSKLVSTCFEEDYVYLSFKLPINTY
jgi:hypothetical protein